MRKLKLDDLDGVDLSLVEIKYTSWGAVDNNKVKLFLDGRCRISTRHKETVTIIDKQKTIAILEDIIASGFFDLPEYSPNFHFKNINNKIFIDELMICDGNSQSIRLRIGDKQRVVESYYDSCTALNNIFKKFENIIKQTTKTKR